MPAYLVNSGVKQEIRDDNFDLLWKEVSEEDEVSTSAAWSDCKTVKKRNGDWRKQDNGYYSTKPFGENYFKKYYLARLKREWICDRCAKTLKGQFSMSKHYKSDHYLGQSYRGSSKIPSPSSWRTDSLVPKVSHQPYRCSYYCAATIPRSCMILQHDILYLWVAIFTFSSAARLAAVCSDKTIRRPWKITHCKSEKCQKINARSKN